MTARYIHPITTEERNALDSAFFALQAQARDAEARKSTGVARLKHQHARIINELRRRLEP